MNTLDAMKQAAVELPKLLDCDSTEDFGATFDRVEDLLREAIAHEEARAAKPDTERAVLVQNLRKGAMELRDVARSCTTHPETTANWKYAVELEQAADMLWRDGIELGINELTAEFEKGYTAGVEAGKKQAQQVSVPQDAQDANRYRWVRDTGNENWMPLATRWCCLEKHCDEYIDAEIAKSSPQPPQGEAE